jgi:hypothetical protein
MADLVAKAREKVLDVLTTEQKEKLKSAWPGAKRRPKPEGKE